MGGAQGRPFQQSGWIMITRHPANIALALTCSVAACVVLFLWIPLDTDTGYVEKVRRRVNIGDALAPTLGAGFVLIGGLFLLFDRGSTKAQLTRQNLIFTITLLAILLASVAVMRWAGPLAAALLTEVDYRVLRDTVPWKYAGFLIGGTGLIAGLIGLVESRLTLRAALIGLAATLALTAVFDLPFEDLLLPPNGDV